MEVRLTIGRSANSSLIPQFHVSETLELASREAQHDKLYKSGWSLIFFFCITDLPRDTSFCDSFVALLASSSTSYISSFTMARGEEPPSPPREPAAPANKNRKQFLFEAQGQPLRPSNVAQGAPRRTIDFNSGLPSLPPPCAILPGRYVLSDYTVRNRLGDAARCFPPAEGQHYDPRTDTTRAWIWRPDSPAIAPATQPSAGNAGLDDVTTSPGMIRSGDKLHDRFQHTIRSELGEIHSDIAGFKNKLQALEQSTSTAQLNQKERSNAHDMTECELCHARGFLDLHRETEAIKERVLELEGFKYGRHLSDLGWADSSRRMWQRVIRLENIVLGKETDVSGDFGKKFRPWQHVGGGLARVLKADDHAKIGLGGQQSEDYWDDDENEEEQQHARLRNLTKDADTRAAKGGWRKDLTAEENVGNDNLKYGSGSPFQPSNIPRELLHGRGQVPKSLEERLADLRFEEQERFWQVRSQGTTGSATQSRFRPRARLSYAPPFIGVARTAGLASMKDMMAVEAPPVSTPDTKTFGRVNRHPNIRGTLLSSVPIKSSAEAIPKGTNMPGCISTFGGPRLRSRHGGGDPGGTWYGYGGELSSRPPFPQSIIWNADKPIDDAEMSVQNQSTHFRQPTVTEEADETFVDDVEELPTD